MKNTLIAAVLTMAAALVLGPGVYAQTAPAAGETATGPTKNPQASLDEDVALLRQDLATKKKQLIAANLQLTDVEATKFWPVYDQYTAEQSKLGDQKVTLIKEYANGFGTVTNDQAISLLKRSLGLDQQYTELRNKYVPIINKVLPGTKTATFFQMDRRISALVDLQIASEIPFVQEQNQQQP